MSPLDVIKTNIKNLYNENPTIHISASLTNPRVVLNNEEVQIKDIYPHIFRVEQMMGNTPVCHTLQYTDVLIKRVVIAELPGEDD